MELCRRGHFCGILQLRSAIFNKYTTLQGESVAAVVQTSMEMGSWTVAYNGDIGLYYEADPATFRLCIRLPPLRGT